MTTPYEEGDPQSRLLVLAEAPARVEMRLGRPLVGPSGDVFNDCLHSAGLIRKQCYILNVWQEPVEKDKVGNCYLQGECLWHARSGFTAAGLDAAAPTLDRIGRSSAVACLTLGQQAMGLLTGDKRPMMKWRGSPLWSDTIDRKFIPTVHPAATLHGTYLWRYLIIADMEKIKGELEDRELVLPKRNLLIRPTYADFYHFINQCREVGRVCTDIEVINHQVSCFSLSCSSEEAMTVPLVGPGGGDYWTEDDELCVWREYAALMSDPSIMKINQNIVGFDAPFLFMQCNIHTKGSLGDPMIAQHIMYPDFNKGLDFIASIHTREPYWKDDGKIWKNPNIDWETFQRYCGRDACVALEAWDVLSKEMTDGDYWPTYNRTARLAGPLTYMTAHGLAVDREGLANTKARLETSIASKEAELTSISQWDFNPTSPKQCQQYFYDTLGLPPYKNPTGGLTTDDKAMSRIVRKAGVGAKEAKLVQEIRALKKLKGTYIDVELDQDSRLRCSWNPRGTWTGRLSSSQTLMGTGMNLQNLHPEFKGFIVAG
jgi:uracil-DNA glycosylase